MSKSITLTVLLQGSLTASRTHGTICSLGEETKEIFNPITKQ